MRTSENKPNMSRARNLRPGHIFLPENVDKPRNNVLKYDEIYGKAEETRMAQCLRNKRTARFQSLIV